MTSSDPDHPETPMSIDEALETMRVWSSMQTISAVRVVRAAECVAEYFGSTRLVSRGAATPAAEALATRLSIPALVEAVNRLLARCDRADAEHASSLPALGVPAIRTDEIRELLEPALGSEP